MADLKLLVIDGQHLLHENTRSNFVATMRSLVDDRTVLLINKVDLIPAAELPTGNPPSLPSQIPPAITRFHLLISHRKGGVSLWKEDACV